MMRRLALLIGLIACDGNGVPEPAAQQTFVPGRGFVGPTDRLTSIIDGDWFSCADALCNRLDDEGLRFIAGTVIGLRADDDPYAGYCLDDFDSFYEILDASSDVILIRVLGANEELLIAFELLGDGNLMHAEFIDEEFLQRALLRRLVPSGPIAECVFQEILPPQPLPGG